jgi:Ca2+-binding RTX toxin-like protein
LVNGSQTIAWSFGIDVAGASADLSITGGTTSSGGGGGGGGGGSGHLDLSVSVSASAAQVEPGADVAYVITVTDLTADPANDLTAMVSLPTGAQVVSTYSERGSGCTVVAGNATVPCDLNYLSKDSPVGRITVVVKLNTAGANVLTASAAARQVELNTANNSGSATVQVGKTAPSPTPVSAPTPTPQSSKGKTVTGSSGPNTLMGTSRNDVLNGLGGNDVLRGLDGNDVLRGGAGRDLLFGGAGNDVLYARDGERDRLDCGAGRDVAYVDKLDTVAHCEQVHRHA